MLKNITFGIIVIIISFAVLIYDDVDKAFITKQIEVVFNDNSNLGDRSKFSIEFKENWVFEKAKTIKLYTDYAVIITDLRVVKYSTSKYKLININDVNIYSKNTLIVVIEKNERYDDDVEISYAWGPLAAHGIGNKIIGNKFKGYDIKVRHRWIS